MTVVIEMFQSGVWGMSLVALVLAGTAVFLFRDQIWGRHIPGYNAPEVPVESTEDASEDAVEDTESTHEVTDEVQQSTEDASEDAVEDTESTHEDTDEIQQSIEDANEGAVKDTESNVAVAAEEPPEPDVETLETSSATHNESTQERDSELVAHSDGDAVVVDSQVGRRYYRGRGNGRNRGRGRGRGRATKHR